MTTKLLIITLSAFWLTVSAVTYAAGSVDGFIKKDAIPQNGVQVEVRSDNDGDYIITVMSDENGFYSLTRIPMGHFTVTLIGEGQKQLAQKEADIFAAGDSVSINFQLE